MIVAEQPMSRRSFVWRALLDLPPHHLRSTSARLGAYVARGFTFGEYLAFDDECLRRETIRRGIEGRMNEGVMA